MVTIVLVAVGVIAAQLATRWARRLWARLRSPRRVEQCAGCNRAITGRRIHTVVSRFTDDALLGIDFGSTGVSADMCGSCCPGRAAGCTSKRHGRLEA